MIISTVNRKIVSPNLKTGEKPPQWDFHFQEFTVPELSKALTEAEFIRQNIYGQRQQLYFKNRYLRRLYLNIFKPNHKSSPAVQKLRLFPLLMPRYMTIKAKKSD